MKETDDTHFNWCDKGQTYWWVTGEKWGKVSRLLDNLDGWDRSHAADTSVIMSNNKASELWV
jgi:hypothetical protein